MTASGHGANDGPTFWWPRLARGGAAGLVAVTTLFGGVVMSGAQGESVRFHAAGSLRAALTEVTRDFTAASGIPVVPVFGASRLLCDRLERGGPETSSPRPTWNIRRRSPGRQGRTRGHVR